MLLPQPSPTVKYVVDEVDCAPENVLDPAAEPLMYIAEVVVLAPALYVDVQQMWYHVEVETGVDVNVDCTPPIMFENMIELAL